MREVMTSRCAPDPSVHVAIGFWRTANVLSAGLC
jgi:hypothetical protein